MPIIPFIIGGIAAWILTSDDTSDYSADEEASERAARVAAAREKARRQREANEYRQKVRLGEAERNLSRVEDRHQRRISSAKSAADRRKAELDRLAAIDHDLDDLFE